MKNLLFLFAICFLFGACNKDEAPEPNTYTPPTYGPASEVTVSINSLVDEYGYTALKNFYVGLWNHSTIPTADGQVVLVGRGGNGGKNSKMVLVKTDTLGDMLYFTEIFDDRYGSASAVCEDAQKNLYVVGSTYKDDTLQNRALSVAKLDADGHILWENDYQRTLESVSGSNIAVLPNGELIIAGFYDDNRVLLKINASGEEIAFEIKESPNYDVTNGMLVLEDGRILVTGNKDQELQLTWYDTDMNLIKEKTYGPRIAHGRSTIRTKDGGLLSVGKFTYTTGNSNVIDSQAVFLVKTDLEGEIIWDSKLGDSQYSNDGQSLKENEDGSIVLSGYSDNNHMLIYVDAAGNEINATYFTDPNTFRGENIIKTEGGRNILTGGYERGTFFINVDNYGN